MLQGLKKLAESLTNPTTSEEETTENKQALSTQKQETTSSDGKEKHLEESESDEIITEIHSPYYREYKLLIE